MPNPHTTKIRKVFETQDTDNDVHRRKLIMEMIDRLEDLKKQATVERSHNYTGKAVTDAIALFYTLLSETLED